MRVRGSRGPVASAALVLTLTPLTACTSADSDPDPSGSASSTATSETADEGAQLDTVLEHSREIVPHYALQVPGVIVLVAQGGQSRELSVGNELLRPKTPMPTDGRFGVASVTKMMVATVILQLED